MKQKYKGSPKHVVCGRCGKDLREKRKVFEIRYDEIGATTKNYQCVCGAFTAIVVMDDESKNVDYVMKKLKY